MRIQFDVTKKDIRLGDIQDIYSCPIARSVKRTLKLRGAKADRLRVVNEALEFEPEKLYDPYIVIASLPAAANNFMADFDEEEPVAPFSFFANFNKRAAKSVGLTLPAA